MTLWFLRTCVVTVALLAGCAFDVLRMEQQPVLLRSNVPPAPSFVVMRDTEVLAGSVYKRVLRKGTRWTWTGRIDGGDVYQTRDQILTVEASNMHEAYLVVADGRVVGFYLPVERAFVSTDPVVLATEAVR